jgi:hypothetical protein
MITFTCLFFLTLGFSKKLIQPRQDATNEFVYEKGNTSPKESTFIENIHITVFGMFVIFGLFQMTSNYHLLALATIFAGISLWFYHLYRRLYAIDFLLEIIRSGPKKENGKPENDSQLMVLVTLMISTMKQFLNLCFVVIFLISINLITNNWYQIIGFFGNV